MKDITVTDGLDMGQSKKFGPYKIDGFHPRFTRIIYRSDVSVIIELRYHAREEDKYESHFCTRQQIPGTGVYQTNKLSLMSKWLTIEVRRASNQPIIKSENFFLEIFDTKRRGVAGRTSIPPPLSQTQELNASNQGVVDRPTHPEEKEETDDDLSIAEVSEKGKILSTSLVISETTNVTEHSKSPFRGSFLKNISSRKKSVANQGASERKTTTVHDSRITPLIMENAILVGKKGNVIATIPPPHCSGLYLMSNEDGFPEWKLPYNFAKTKI